MNKQMMLVIDHNEITEDEIYKIHDQALRDWKKIIKSIERARRKQIEIESMIEVCRSRLRLLRIMKNQ